MGISKRKPLRPGAAIELLLSFLAIPLATKCSATNSRRECLEDHAASHTADCCGCSGCCGIHCILASPEAHKMIEQHNKARSAVPHSIVAMTSKPNRGSAICFHDVSIVTINLLRSHYGNAWEPFLPMQNASRIENRDCLSDFAGRYFEYFSMSRMAPKGILIDAHQKIAVVQQHEHMVCLKRQAPSLRPKKSLCSCET